MALYLKLLFWAGFLVINLDFLNQMAFAQQPKEKEAVGSSLAGQPAVGLSGSENLEQKPATDQAVAESKKLELGAEASSATAPPRGVKKDKDFTLKTGAVIIRAPTFVGSDKFFYTAFPSLEAEWYGRFFAGVRGIGYKFFKTPVLTMSVAAKYDPGRKESGGGLFFTPSEKRLKGLGTIDNGASIHFLSEAKLPGVTLKADLTKHTVAGNSGYNLEFGASSFIYLSPKLFVIPSISATWDDQKHSKAYYGVTDKQAANSIFNKFEAEAGINKASFGFNTISNLSPKWSLVFIVNQNYLLGSAKDSPISFADRYFAIVAGFSYSIY